MQKAIEQFLSSSAFGVAGASNNRAKFGNKVLRCYMQHNLQVYPINLTEETVEGLKCVKKISDLPNTVKSLSIITPPPITEKLVKAAIEQGIENIWMQPGAESKEAEWSDKLSFGELSGIADQLVQIIHEAVAHHEIFKEIAMPSLAYLQKRDILAVEADPEKQIALFPQYDEETQGAFAQYEKINDISEQKNVEMAAIAEELKKSKFSGQAPAEETIIKAVLGMVELYAVFAAAAIAGDIVTTLHAYRGASIERIEHKLLGEDDASLYEK